MAHPLRCAARGHLESVRWLLAVGAATAIRNHSGSTPLHAAAANGQTEAVRALLADEHDAIGTCPLAQVKDGEGRSAAMIAMERGHATLAQLIMDHEPSEEPAGGEAPPVPVSSEFGTHRAARQAHDGAPPTDSAGAAGVAGGALDALSRSELTVLLDLLGEIGDRREPPLTSQQASCVAKLGSALFALRWHRAS